ncbi:CDP-alcohol phosphatidyltransferase family protein [Desulfomonile tiedjei]|uniref:Phosphatidylglycerophosphate synthase n=1 Tax=Desulfomonile tiedjei (strain ATCC 49306 / DSM 6799 / DCB-1) TaxID=706587 RepID=I4C2J1_DESTA|nr:CDP-alcohol phosphatidyltransferase family protein [Desulfomonile tiedjei]AFM23782.1 phosphatidylglycerophosphate synthase [Desulfomonile tiedjei DSM 6799]
MLEPVDNKNETAGANPPKSKSYKDFFNYFGEERVVHDRFAEFRTRLISHIVPIFSRMGIVPDTISYVGITFLAGVILYFVRNPVVAVLFLAGHVFFDGVDGAYARHTGKASQSGAFTDLVCDQFGMVVVSLMVIFHHMVAPLIGAVYMALYLMVVVFGVIINAIGLKTRITVTSKYFLYLTYAAWAIWEVNLFAPMMTFFSAIMALQVLIGYLRLKRGIRKKFDSEVRFSAGDPYSGKLNYIFNLAIPALVLLIILIWGNWIPLRAMIDIPKQSVSWSQGIPLIPEEKTEQLLGFGIQNKDFLVLCRKPDDHLEVTRFSESGQAGQSFTIPEYVSPMFGTFPVDRNILLIPDDTTRLLMGIDLDASFAARQAVMVMTLPFKYLRVTAMTTGEWKGKKVWLAANYLYTRRTYVIDPEKALKKGYLLGGLIASYVNAGYPHGMVIRDRTVIEYNRSPLQKLIYAAPLKSVIAGTNLMDAAKTSFFAPRDDVFGPAIYGDSLVVLSPEGKLYKLPLAAFLVTTQKSDSKRTPH